MELFPRVTQSLFSLQIVILRPTGVCWVLVWQSTSWIPDSAAGKSISAVEQPDLVSCTMNCSELQPHLGISGASPGIQGGGICLGMIHEWKVFVAGTAALPHLHLPVSKRRGELKCLNPTSGIPKGAALSVTLSFWVVAGVLRTVGKKRL